jgi:hypothetical protein
MSKYKEIQSKNPNNMEEWLCWIQLHIK